MGTVPHSVLLRIKYFQKLAGSRDEIDDLTCFLFVFVSFWNVLGLLSLSFTKKSFSKNHDVKSAGEDRHAKRMI